MPSIYSEKIKARLAEDSRLVVAYLLAGYENNVGFFESMEICENGGVDIFEIGFPSKNPYADGEVIAKAHASVDYAKATSLEYWKKIRQKTDKVIWLMAYYEDFISSDIYMEFAKNGIMDGVVIPDADIVQREEIQKALAEYNVDVVGFANPNMGKSELDKVFDKFPLVYEQLYIGQTGVVQTEETYHEMLDYTLDKKASLPFAGFGINSGAKVKKILDEGFVGAIIGTEIIKKINCSKECLIDFMKEIKMGV